MDYSESFKRGRIRVDLNVLWISKYVMASTADVSALSFPGIPMCEETCGVVYFIY